MPRRCRAPTTSVVACTLCHKYFSEPFLPAHIAEKHSAEVLGCQKCELKFVSQAMLDQHVKEDHDDDGSDQQGASCMRTGEARAPPTRKVEVVSQVSKAVKSGSLPTTSGESILNSQSTVDDSLPTTEVRGERTQIKVYKRVESEAPGCPVCGKKTGDFQAMTIHMMSHVDSPTKVVFACEECAELFDSKSALIKHKWTHEPETKTRKKSQASHGGDNTSKDQEKRKTSLSVRKKKVFCVFCQKAFTNLEALNEHRREVHGQGPLEFGRTLTNPLPSRKRTQSELTTRTPPGGGSEYCCTMCGQGPMNYEEVNEHRRIEHDAGPVDMGRKFGSGSTLLDDDDDEVDNEELDDEEEDDEEEEDDDDDDEQEEDSDDDPNLPQEAEETAAGSSRTDKTNEETWQKFVDNVTKDSEDILGKECGVVFESKDELRTHARYHLISVDWVSGPFTCPVCGERSSSKSELERHLLTCSKVAEDIPKEVPEQEIDVAEVIESNENITESSINTRKKHYECFICGEVFSSQRKLNLHQKTHPEMRFHCELCGLIFITKRGLEHHTVREHSQDTGKEFPCELCDKAFNNTITLKQHMSGVHTYKDRFECEFCDKKFAFTARLREHVRSVHVRDAKYKCEECGDAFVHNNTFKNHMKRHRGEKIVTRVRSTPAVCSMCPTCGKVVAQTSLKLHLKTHEKSDLPCQFCTRRFTNELYLNQHMKRHTSEPHLKCPFCERMFRRASALNEHVVSHTGDKSFFCDACGFRTGTVGRLKKHKRSQHQNFKYQCWKCPVSVNSNHGLVRHFMQHSQEFPYRCSYCQKLFIIEANAKRHIDFHRRKGTDAEVLNNLFEIYHCHECGKPMRSFANLAVHLYTTHKKQKHELPVPPKQMRTAFDVVTITDSQGVGQIQIPVVSDSNESGIIWNTDAVECVPLASGGQTIDIDVSGGGFPIEGIPVTILNADTEISVINSGAVVPTSAGKDALALAVSQIMAVQAAEQEQVVEIPVELT